MDTIETFLDNMFAPYPATPRLIEARSELRAMMEDAYGQRIQEMSQASKMKLHSR